VQRLRDHTAAKYYLEGETGSKYDWKIHKDTKPRDTLSSLRRNNEE
jgi:hypothetical protein